MQSAFANQTGGERFERLAADLAEAARLLGGRGWTPATSSNFSVRLDETHCAVTISGRDKTRLTAADLMVLRLDGTPIAAPDVDTRPSAETALHLALYRRDPDTGAVLHTHAPNAVLTTRLAPDAEQITLEGYELLKAFEGVTSHDHSLIVPVVDNSQDIDALASEADQRLDRLDDAVCWAYLIRDHGAYAWGRDLAASLRHLEALDYLLGIELELGRLRRD